MQDASLPRSTRVLVTLAGFVVVVAGLKAASPIIVPFLLSVFIAILCAPPLYWLQRHKVPKPLAVLLILVAVVGIIVLLGVLGGRSVTKFTQALPLYQERLAEQTDDAARILGKFGIQLGEDELRSYIDPAKVMRVAGSLLSGLSGMLTNTFLIVLTVVFILLEASDFPGKLKTAFDDPTQHMAGFAGFTETVNRYLKIKTIFSALTGICIWAWLAVLGVDYPVLWGSLAFLLNYVPNIGSIIAAVPAVLLALVQLGSGSALLATAGYVAVNVVFGSILEPRYMGGGLGLSALVVFLSLVFWGWVLGPVGMILSVPLTVIMKIALESGKDTRWLAIMLGSGTSPATAPRPGA